MQRLVLYAVLGLLLDAIGQDWTTWGFWCVLALFIANEHITRRELIEQLQAEVAAARAAAGLNNNKDNTQ